MRVAQRTKTGDVVPQELIRLAKFLPQGDDITLIILKSHLLIEEQLFSLATSMVTYPAAIKKGKLGFSDLLSFTKALFYRADEIWFWDAIKKLNNIRNDLAHKLEAPRLEMKLNQFLKLVEENKPYRDHRPPDKLSQRLKGAIFFLHGMACGLSQESQSKKTAS